MKSTMPSRPVGASDSATWRSRAIDLRVRVDHQHRVKSFGQLGIARASEDRLHVAQALTRNPPLDRADHRRLDILGEDDAIWPNASRQPDREPSATGTDIGHASAVEDLELVHDPLGLLPFVSIRTLEEPELFGWKQPCVRVPLLRGERGRRHHQRRKRGDETHACHRNPPGQLNWPSTFSSTVEKSAVGSSRW
jgi:hypothetical protein